MKELLFPCRACSHKSETEVNVEFASSEFVVGGCDFDTFVGCHVAKVKVNSVCKDCRQLKNGLIACSNCNNANKNAEHVLKVVEEPPVIRDACLSCQGCQSVDKIFGSSLPCSSYFNRCFKWRPVNWKEEKKDSRLNSEKSSDFSRPIKLTGKKTWVGWSLSDVEKSITSKIPCADCPKIERIQEEKKKADLRAETAEKNAAECQKQLDIMKRDLYALRDTTDLSVRLLKEKEKNIEKLFDLLGASIRSKEK